MIKRTIYIESECHLSVEYEQLKISNKTTGELNSLPIEDIGFIMFDNRMITYTHCVLQKFAQYNVATIICDEKHLPAAMLNPLTGHSAQAATFKSQLNLTDAVKNSLWKQTIVAKISNQARVLNSIGKDDKFLKNLAKSVKSGDSDNREAVAAKHYWKELFDIPNFKREREGIFPNSFLNYSYSIIRAGIARALIASGVLPTIGIHHQNKYNSMCLADDIMEPYRPYADAFVLQFIKSNPEIKSITKDFKLQALKILSSDTKMRNLTRPMMIAFSYTSSSLAKCFLGKLKTINYPEFH